MELLRGVAATLRFPGPDGDPAGFAKDPVVTVTRHSDGSAIVTDAATTEVTGEAPDPYYTVDLTGDQLAEVDLLIASWSDGASTYTTHAEVVGGFVTSLAAIRAEYDDDDRTDAQIAAAREAATTQLEAACRVAFRPRYGKAVLDGAGTDTLQLPDPILQQVLSATVDGEAVDPAELTVDRAGFLIRSGRWSEGRANVAVAYVHGYEVFGPAELPVISLAAHLLTNAPTDFNQRATSYSTGDVTYSLVTAGVRGASFALPEVNSFVQDNRFISVG